jgi:predicted RecB family nuclease
MRAFAYFFLARATEGRSGWTIWRPAAQREIEVQANLRLLAAEQGLMPPRIHIVLGDGSTVALMLSDFHYYFDIARQRIEDFVALLPETSVGQPCGHCGLCRWSERCEAQWEALRQFTRRSHSS